MKILKSILILNILCWASFVEAQQWDWVRSLNKSNDKNFGVSFNDSFGNIYNFFEYFPTIHYLKNSQKFNDTLKNIEKPLIQGNLIKSNKRGKLLWQVNCWGKPKAIDFFNNNIYLLCEFSQSKFSIFTFGKSSFNLTNYDKKRLYYIIFKYDKDGKEIEANIIFNNSTDFTMDVYNTNFKVFNESQIFLNIPTSFYHKITQLGINYKDSIAFKNKILYSGTNEILYPFTDFLSSFTFQGNINWAIGHKFSYGFKFNFNNKYKYILIQTNDGSSKIDTTRHGDIYFFQYDLQGNLLNRITLDRKFDPYTTFVPNIYSPSDGNYYILTREANTFLINNHTITVNFLEKNIYFDGRKSVLIKLNQNLQYEWHKINQEDSSLTNYSSIITDKKGNIFSIFDYTGVYNLDGLILDGKPKDVGGSYKSPSLILKMNTTGKITSIVKFPSAKEDFNNFGRNNILQINKLWLDSKENINCSGQFFNTNKNIFVDIDSFYLEPFYGRSLFQAKYNNQKLQLVKKYLYCKNDSLKADADTAYKKFRWVINGKTYWDIGKGIKPSLPTNGKYYVSLYGYEDDSVSSLHNDSIMFYEPPKANITTDKQNICRYSSIVFKDNSTIANSFGNIINSYLNFGDSRDTLRNINNKSNVSIHQYTDTGLFNIQYIISHNGCKDTQILSEHIKVINSPKSDFTIVKDKNCTPVLLDLKSNYTGYFDSMTWFLNGKKLISTTKNVEQILIKNSGNQEIMHIIYGYGCSNTTSETIKIEKGFNPKDSIVLNYATISDNKDILLSWNKHNAAIKYMIFDGSKSIETRDTFLKLNNYLIQKQSYKFNVIAFDTCGNRINSNTASTILLSGFSEEFNKNSTLNWTPYTFWNQGIKLYKIEFYNIITNTWESLIEKDSNTIKFIDLNFFNQIDNSSKKCYRIIALENNSNYSSSSNEICIDYQPFIFAPNSFTPNNDELNDTYEIKVIGAKDYTFSVYSRWGEKLFEGNENNKSWDGKYANNPCNDGVYMIIFSMTTPNGKILNFKSSFTLLR